MQKTHRPSQNNKKASLNRHRASASHVSRKLGGGGAHVKNRRPAPRTSKVKASATGRRVAVSKKLVAGLPSPAEVETDKIKEADVIISGGIFSEFVVKNVGKQGVDMMKALNSSPHTDDKLAVRMNTKVNEVRRMLNVLNGYGITKYDINKDGKGWLTFKWYLDRGKLSTFNGVLLEKQNGQKVTLQENCNDFFYCAACYNNQKLILPFDSAYELHFKCESCGKILGVLNKEEANALFSSGKVI